MSLKSLLYNWRVRRLASKELKKHIDAQELSEDVWLVYTPITAL